MQNYKRFKFDKTGRVLNSISRP